MIGVLLMAVLAIVTEPTSAETPRKAFEALLNSYDLEYGEIRRGARETKGTGEAIDHLNDRYERLVFGVAQEYAKDDVAVEALNWIFKKGPGRPTFEQALKTLLNVHVMDGALQKTCVILADSDGTSGSSTDSALRIILERSPHRSVKGQACISLASRLVTRKEAVERQRYRSGLWGLPGVPFTATPQIEDRELQDWAKEASALCQRVLREFEDVKCGETTLGKLARATLYEIQNLSVGSKSPIIVGKDLEGRALQPSDFVGHVVVLKFGSHRSCAPCRAGYPHDRALVKRLQGKAFVFLGINSDDNRDELRMLVKTGVITWRCVLDGPGHLDGISNQWNIKSWPTYFIIGRDGIIRHKGMLQAFEIDKSVESLLSPDEGRKPHQGTRHALRLGGLHSLRRSAEGKIGVTEKWTDTELAE